MMRNPTTCPQCGYSFRGLPADRECSECGFARDEHTVVLQARGPWGITLAGLPALFLGGYSILWAAQLPLGLLALLVGDLAADVLGALLCVALFGCGLYLLVRLWLGKQYAAVTPAGIQARTVFREFLVPWNEFQYVQMYAFIPTVFAEGKAPYRAHLVGTFGSRRRFDEFDEAVEAALMRWRNHGTRDRQVTVSGAD